MGAPPSRFLAMLLRSDDRGATWTERTFALDLGRAAYLSAVDPADPDRLFVRIDDPTGDRLLVGTNGGDNWTEVWKARGSLLGFALSADGREIAVGGPFDGILVSSVSSAAAFAFERRSDVGARCLTFIAGALFACADEAKDGFSLGRSSDGGRTFAPLYRTTALALQTCPPGTPTREKCRTLPAVLDRGDAGTASDAGGLPAFLAGGSRCSQSASGGEAFGVLSVVALVFRAIRRRRASPP
jgi:hypothetical protein